MSSSLQGKVAIVTGAARGTGEAIARLFTEQGACVVIADLRVEQGRELAASLGERALFVECDVSRKDDWEALIAHTSAAFGDPAVLVNNAALLDVSPLEAVTEQTMTRLFRVNQLGPVLGIQAVLPGMRTLGYGSIINIGSTDGVLGQDMGLIAYGATKFALRGITRISAMELGRHAIRVNCIVPDSGNIEMSSPFLPPEMDHDAMMRQHVEQILRPPPWASGFHRFSEIAQMALFLASDASSGCTGADFPVDGGYTAGRRYIA
jgi:3alpha(or 20beta)-hydroxysteroid dehydrogenase